jgi:hypothetical protein
MNFKLIQPHTKVQVNTLQAGSLIDYDGQKYIVLGKLFEDRKIYTARIPGFQISYFTDLASMVTNLGLVQFEE